MNPDDYWFRKKSFGWGWGAPNNLQGWIFLAAWVALIIFGARTLRGISGVMFLIGMLSVLGVVLYFRGEPPAWTVEVTRRLTRLSSVDLLRAAIPQDRTDSQGCEEQNNQVRESD